MQQILETMTQIFNDDLKQEETAVREKGKLLSLAVTDDTIRLTLPDGSMVQIDRNYCPVRRLRKARVASSIQQASG